MLGVFVLAVNTWCFTADCKLLYESGYTADGVYPGPLGTSGMVCDMSRLGGGWTIIQRRVDDSVDFYRGWADYVAGFGDLTGNFWAGLDSIHALTAGVHCELYVYMESFEAESAWAAYSTFAVGDAASGYLLTATGYTGTAGDSLSSHSGQRFSTYDNDQDAAGENCAVTYVGAWWYAGCHSSNPNAQYLWGATSSYANSVGWSSWKGHYYSLKTIEFLVRRV
jgi:ficolin